MPAHMKLPSPTFWDLRGGERKPMTPPHAPVVMCLGNFDGVHQAHSALLRQGLTLRDEKLPEGLCGVFTFVHPSSDYLHGAPKADTGAERTLILKAPHQQQHLSTMDEKLRLFQALGIDFVCLCDFQDIYTLPPEAFLSFLADHLSARGAVCGFNYHFGAGGKGTVKDLTSYFDRPDEGFFYAVTPPYLLDGEVVSSTRIRKLLQLGLADEAAKHLGRPYALENTVVKGKQLGRKLGFPTANQYFLPESLVPAHGVYAVLCHTPLGIYPGVANVGSHPTVDEHAAVNCETYVLGPAQDLYGYRMKVEFLCRLRGEEKFSSLDALTAAITRDAKAASAYVEAYLSSAMPSN